MSILVLAEHDHGALNAGLFNTLGAAAKIGGDVHVLLLGPAAPAELQIKFRRRIRPAARLVLGLALKETAGRRQVIFDYASDGVACSSGKITLCGP